MTPLHSCWEYEQACRVCDYYENKANIQGLSDQEKREYRELSNRVMAYINNPTQPNIIKAAPGQVDNIKNQENENSNKNRY